ncbi:MAG: hypothetical protein K9K76_01850 [Halanaerobiales bacterium]|nr:hypothetical protein [Halanaerobiales bacterium]
MYSKKITLLILAIVLIASPTMIQASSNYQMGGTAKAGLNALFFDDTSQVEIYDSINLEFSSDNTAFEIDVMHNLTKNELDMTLKKAYFRKKIMGSNITIGKQPISWSFGSLINTTDYSLGAEALNEETSAKYVNGVKIDYPFNWYSSLSLVREFNSEYDYKYGFRGRTLINDYDVSVNWVDQKSNNSDLSRWGLTLKGDISNTGVYGSYTHVNYKTTNFEINTEGYMVGADYSYFLNQGYGNRLYLQGEYHLLEKNEGLNVLLNSLAGAGVAIPPSKISNEEKYFKVFLSNINYNINDFSSIGFFTITSLEDGSTALIPNYRNQLTNNTTLKVNLSYLSGSSDEVFSGGNRLPGVVCNIELSYAF